MIPTHPYQEEAARSIATAGAKLLADQPGLGKTHTALRALVLRRLLEETTPSIILIAAPLMVCDTAWVPKFRLYFPHVTVVNAYSGSRHARNRRIEDAIKAQKDGPVVIIANHDALGINKQGEPHLPALHTLTFDALLIDESQLVLPTEADTPGESTQFWRGLFALSDHTPPGALRLAMSGTPDRGKLWYRFGTWRFLRPRVLERTRYQQWLERNFVVWYREVPVKGRDFKVRIPQVGRLKDPSGWAALDRALVIRRTKAEVAPQLPPKLYLDIDVPFDGKQYGAYADFVRRLADEDDGSTNGAAVLALRAQQWADATWQLDPDGILRPAIGGASAKLDWLVEFLTARGHLPGEMENPEGGKVVITSQFVRVLDWLHVELNKLGVRALEITGEQTAAQRTEIQQQFQRNDADLRVVLLSSSIGVGIDLDAADDLVFFDLPRDPDEQEQVEDRVHRVSRIHQVMIWRLRSRGTIDMLIQAKNDQVYRQTRELMDGTRGVEFERKLLARLR